MTKRQFKGGRGKRPFYDRKVRTQGFSRIIALGKVIPRDWRYVRIAVQSKNHNHVVLVISKLLGAEINAKDTRKT